MNETVLRITRVQKISFAAGILFLLLGGGLGVLQPRGFFISYLIAFIFWTGLALGCLNATMIHNLTGGRWGNVTRRFFEAGAMTLPLMAILFIPILSGLPWLYAWARPDAVVSDLILQKKAVYENFIGFLFRAIVFFSGWIIIALCLRKWSLRQDETADVTPTLRMRILSGPGIVLVPLLATFAFVDWIMSIEPVWFSTVFPLILLSGQILNTYAFAIMLLAWFQPLPPFHEAVTEKHFHDLGNILLTFVMFWTYVAFSQFLIVYSANQPHEIGWYLHRIAGSWKWLAAFIALFHFFVPFLVLLFRPAKKNSHVLAAIALLIFTVHALETLWVIAPTFYPNGIQIHWTDFAVGTGMGGIWLGVFAFNLKRHPLLARKYPPVENCLTQSANAK